MMKCRAYTISPQSTLAVVIVNHSTEIGFFFFFGKIHLLGSLANDITCHGIIRH